MVRKDGVLSIDSKVDKDQVFNDLHTSDKYVSNKRDTWNDKEDLFFSKNADDVSDETKSQMHDPRLSEHIIERSGRVTNQLPTGKVMALTKDDRGKNKLMSLVLDKWIFSNAKSQYPLQTKFKLQDMYSQIYGSMFGLVDWVVDRRRNYIGPDYFLIPIRDVFPQVGATSLEDSDYINISTLRTKEWLKARDPETWTNIDKVIKKIKPQNRSSMSTERVSTRYSDFYTSDQTDDKNPPIEVVTRYERDRWVTFLPEYHEIIRVIENPHKNEKGKSNGELPVIAKYCFPVLEDFFGLGEMERGESLQKSLDSLINLYFDGLKMSLYPPLQINTKEVIASSIRMRPAQKMYVDKPNQSVQAMQVSPQGLNTFVPTYQFLLSSLENLSGTSSTTVSSNTDKTMGKTPQALKMQSARENTRDLMDRYQMEQTVQQVVEKMINLEATKMEAPVVLSLFKREIQDIAKEYPDIVSVFSSGQAGKVTVTKDLLRAKYRYEIDSGSMVRKDDEVQMDNLNTMLSRALEGAQINPQSGEVTSPLIALLKQDGVKLNVGELFKRSVIQAAVPDWDKIIIEENENGGQALVGDQDLDAMDQDLAALEEQLGGQGMMQDTQIDPMMQSNSMMGGMQ